MTDIRIQLRRGTAALWASVNPVLALGEPGLETDTRKVKYGDGVSDWNSLAYAADVGVTDHGALTGLADDDHPQYLTNARGDARYDALGDADAAEAAAVATAAADATTKANAAQAAAIADANATKVPITRTVNGHALNANVTVTASDVGAPSGSGTSTGTNTGDQDLSGLQPKDSDLTAIAALAPADDSIIQRKAGAWVDRTLAQLRTDLVFLPLADTVVASATSYTISASDHGKLLRFQAGTTITVTVDSGSLVSNHFTGLRQDGAGQVVVVAGTGVVRTAGTAKTRALYSALYLTGNQGASAAYIDGDMSAS